MHRVDSLGMQFAPAPSQPATNKVTHLAGNFTNTWSYLNMDQFLSKEGIEYRKKCEKFMDEINPTVSDLPLQGN